MKKRIIASTMASVLALSGASSALVASAASYEDFKSQSVSRAELKEFMETAEIKELVDGGVDNYGSVSGENFQRAVDFANAVIDDADATADDATAAYLMVKAAKEALKHHTKEELQMLLEECKPTYDTNNELNEDDAIYKEGDWSDFVDAYETAYDCRESDDLLETTDAYEKLDENKKPGELTKKTKSQIDKARNNYIKALSREFDFQPWQRGTVEGTGTDYDGLTFAWGTLYAHILSAKDELMDTYEDFTKLKGRSVTTNTEIVEAVNAMEAAAKVLNGFSSTFETKSTKASVTDLLGDYHGQLVHEYNAAEAQKVALSFLAAVGNVTNGEAKFMVNGEETVVDTGAALADQDDYWNENWSAKKKYQPLGDLGKVSGNGGDAFTKNETKLIGAEIRIKSNAPMYYVINKDRKLANGKYAIVDIGDGKYFDGDKSVMSDYVAGSSVLQVCTLNKKQFLTISDYIDVSAENILASLVGSLAGGAANDYNTAVSNLDSALQGLYSNDNPATGTIAADLTSVAALISDINGAPTVATGSDDKKLQGKVSDAKKAAEAYQKALYAARNDVVAKTITDDSVKALISLQTKLKTAVKAVSDLSGTFDTDWSGAQADIKAYNTYSVVSLASSLSSLRADVETELNALTDTLETQSKSEYNSVMDKYNEMQFKQNSDNKTDKGLKYFHDGDLLSAFQFEAYESSRNADRACSLTVVSLAKAVQLYQEFTADKIDCTGAKDIDNMLTISNNLVEEKNDPKAWRLLYNYMKYALEDQFKADADKIYTLSDVIKLTETSEKLLTDTVETALFTGSHNNLVFNVNAANAWIKLAKADKSEYQNYSSAYDVDTVGAKTEELDEGEKDSTKMYNELNDTYKQLKKEYDGFKYGYGEIVKKMADIAKKVDAGQFNAEVSEKLAKALDETAGEFIKVTEVYDDSGDALDDCGLFNDDGSMNTNNRLFTYGDKLDSLYFDGGTVKVAQSNKSDKDNYKHYLMQKAYENLLKVYDDATKAPEDKVTTDVDGNGKFELADVSAMLKIYVDKKGEVSKHDFNKDGKVDLTDVTELLKQYINKK